MCVHADYSNLQPVLHMYEFNEQVTEILLYLATRRIWFPDFENEQILFLRVFLNFIPITKSQGEFNSFAVMD